MKKTGNTSDRNRMEKPIAELTMRDILTPMSIADIQSILGQAQKAALGISITIVMTTASIVWLAIQGII